MAKPVLSEKARSIYTFLDDNPDIAGMGTKALLKFFPEETKDRLAFHKSQWKKKRMAGTWPEQPGNSNYSVTNIQKEPPALIDDLEESESSIKEKDIQLDIKNLAKSLFEECETEETRSSTSIDTSESAFICTLFEKRDIIMDILAQFEQTGAVPLAGLTFEGPFKNVTFNVMQTSLDEFSRACNEIGVSQRKAVHVALADFIQKYVYHSR